MRSSIECVIKQKILAIQYTYIYIYIYIYRIAGIFIYLI